MAQQGTIKKLYVSGFKSIRELNDFELRPLNIFIGANGAGKSNLVQLFRMLMAMAGKHFQKFVLENGGADNFLHNGPKHTETINLALEFISHSSYSEGSNFYRCILTPTVDDIFLIEEDRKYKDSNWNSYGSASKESRLCEKSDEKSMIGTSFGIGYYVYNAISNWMVYHFHDTSPASPMRRSEIIEDNFRLRHNGSNLAPFLLSLKNTFFSSYDEIVNAIRLVLPFFDDFILDIFKYGEAEKVRLSWRQKGSDFPMQPYHLSDGSIRFICLATALLQPNPPSTIIIDEPELGLHPEAIRMLGELMQDAAKRAQLIVATQSPLLLDQFAVEDIVVVRREGGQSVFSRLQRDDFAEWLEEYSVGDLWTRNIIQGGSNHE
ncbi:MAG: AAA family ATPase [bacterium]|nr:AAA family ATPase [bacterium]